MTDSPHAARAAARRLDQQTAALERAARDVADQEARLASARGARDALLVICVTDQGWPVSLAAAAAGVSRETAHKILRR
jgi:transcriptional regulator of acetoin/glycerol metabolism